MQLFTVRACHMQLGTVTACHMKLGTVTACHMQLGTVTACHMQSEDCLFRNLAPFCVLISLLLLHTNVYLLTVKLWFRFITDANCSQKYVLLNTAHIWQANWTVCGNETTSCWRHNNVQRQREARSAVWWAILRSYLTIRHCLQVLLFESYQKSIPISIGGRGGTIWHAFVRRQMLDIRAKTKVVNEARVDAHGTRLTVS
jgi:hypothetical protein